jgi:hypothetical protein
MLMGAEVFEVISHGATPQEAYDAAVAEALYWHGHGGYTGTIAEKPGFVMVDIPGFPDNGDSLNDFNRLVNALSWYMGSDNGWDEEQSWPWAKLAKADAEFLRDTLGAGGLRQLYDQFDDKWGPAVCIKVSDGAYGFCGWASC